jgi:hypothetical protein
MMTEYECGPERAPSLSVVQWREAMGLPADCLLTPAQEVAIHEALLQADEDVARYASWWPAPTVTCEEIPVAIRSGGCCFARAGLSRRATLRFGRVQRVEAVEFLRRAGGCTPDVDCYVVTPAAVCVVDRRHGTIELDPWAAASCAAHLERVRIRYVSGNGGELGGLRSLLARYAATLLPSPHLCDLDLRFDGWERYTLTESDTEHKQEHAFGMALEFTGRTLTDRTLTKRKEQRLPLHANTAYSPFGSTPAGLQIWRYLKSRRRLRATHL